MGAVNETGRKLGPQGLRQTRPQQDEILSLLRTRDAQPHKDVLWGERMIPLTEQELIVNMDPIDPDVRVYSNMQRTFRKLRGFMKNPAVRVLKNSEEEIELLIPKELFVYRLKTKRVMTDEARETVRKRFALAREKKAALQGA